MTKTRLSLASLGILALLAACSTPGSSLAPTSTPALASAPAATSVQPPAAAAAALDPCQLVNNSRASALAGTSFGAGMEGNVPGGTLTCTYGSQTTNVFTVEVTQAADAAAASVAKANFMAQLQENLQQMTNEGLNATEVPGLGDGATFVQANIVLGDQPINGSAIGVRKGTIFFGFSDVVFGKAAPAYQALLSEAISVLARLQ